MTRLSRIGPECDADTSEDEASMNSSIFQASLYFVGEEEEGGEGRNKERQSATQNQAATLGTSVDSCSTLVPNALDTATSNYMGSDTENSQGGADTPKLVAYGVTNLEPLCVYVSPMEPTELPPSMPGPPAQKRAEALAEILFRQDMQTYGLHVSTSTAAMSYIRRSEYHETLRATEFNFRAIQSQQRAYGDLRNHPFYHTPREDSPLLRSGTWIDSNDERTRRRHRRRSRSGSQEGVDSGTGGWESGVWGGLWGILCCIALPVDGYSRDTAGDWC